MKKWSIVAIAALAFLGITNPANAAAVLLQTNDSVGITFWIVSMGMLAGAGLGAAEDILALEDMGNGLRLDGGGLGVARVGDGLQDVVAQT